MAEPDWLLITEAALRASFPRLPEDLPPAVAEMLPVWAARVAALDPSVRQEQLGPYGATYTGAWLTDIDRLLLGQYKRTGAAGSTIIDGPSAQASAAYYADDDEVVV